MNFKKHRVLNPELIFATLFLVAGCGNNIIERSAVDYFPYAVGNWWRYNNNSSYDPQTIFVEVEPLDTLLQIECYPVTYSGVVSYYALGNTGVREYVKITHAFAGAEYTVLEGFVKRVVTPLVTGSNFADSLADSLNISGAWIKGKYEIRGLVSGFTDDVLYGNVYQIAFTVRKTVADPDTTIIWDRNFNEYYAPGIGLVRFDNDQGEFHLSEYDLK
jgi:hypothetical protein